MVEPDNKPEFPSNAVAQVIYDIITTIPKSQEPVALDPKKRASHLITSAALKAGAVSGTLALPVGPLGLVTILPDMYAVWSIQAQLVADIAAAFGKSAQLSQKQMLYCLFKLAAAQLLRDLVTRVGERVIFRSASLRALQGLARKIGVRVTRQLIANSLARWVPLIGAVGVAGYAAWDTHRVGQTTLELFERPFEVEPEPTA